MTCKQSTRRHAAEDVARDLIASYLGNEDSPGLHAPDLDYCVQVLDPRLAADEIIQVLLDEGWVPPTTRDQP